MTDDTHLEGRMSAAETSISVSATDIVEIKGDVKQLLAMANRWRGAFVVILAVGGMIGWFADKVVSVWERVK